MNKKNILIIIIIFIIIVSYLFYIESKKTKETSEIFLDQKNCAYKIDDKMVLLKNGYSEEDIIDSNSKIITKYFGNEIKGDFDEDGLSDSAFILTQDLGGSGIFYYVAVAFGSKTACFGSNAIFLGDRIAPQTISFLDGEIVVNFAVRKDDEAMTALPSVGVSKYLKVVDKQLIEID
ncbi:MAG: hypothetical protein WC414_00540 [Patescibacteria group bacterium]